MIDFKTYFFGKDENRCLEDDSFIPIWKPCAAVLVVCACRQPCDLVFHLWWIALSVGDLLALARLPACFFFLWVGKGNITFTVSSSWLTIRTNLPHIAILKHICRLLPTKQILKTRRPSQLSPNGQFFF